MNWFEKLMPSKIRTSGGSDKKNVPEGLWAKCSNCDAIIYRAELERNQEVCTKCDHHLRIGARGRLESFFDEEGRQELASGLEADDILKFRDDKKYRDRLSQAQKHTGEKDALLVMRGTVMGVEMVAAAFEFQFMGGSMGSVVGRINSVGDHPEKPPCLLTSLFGRPGRTVPTNGVTAESTTVATVLEDVYPTASWGDLQAEAAQLRVPKECITLSRFHTIDSGFGDLGLHGDCFRNGISNHTAINSNLSRR